MKGQGSGMWLVAVGLIALFMVATMVAPAMLHPSTGDSNDTTDDDNGAPQTLEFKAPTVSLGSSSVEQDGSTGLSLKTAPTTPTTGKGGSFVWVISIEGANGQGNAVQIHYGDQMVQWFAGGDGTLVGVGPRFSQGPGAASVEVSASMNVTPLVAGSYTIMAWVAVGKDLVSLNPSGLQACSPEASNTFSVSEKAKTEAKVVQTLEGPSTAGPNKYIRFTLTSSGHATGKWRGTVADKLTIAKNGIGRTDVRLRVIDGSGSVSWSDKGNYLEATLQTNKPFDGKSSSEDAEWSVTFELSFTSAGTYVVETSAVDTYSGLVLSTPISHPVVVAKAPAPTTNQSAPTPAPATPPAAAPVNTTNATTPAGSASASDEREEDDKEEKEKEEKEDKDDKDEE